MSHLKDAKSLILEFYKDLDAATPEEAAQILQRYTASDYRWRGSYPFDELNGAEAVAEAFWAPYKRAFSPIQRRENIFFASQNRLDGEATTWVCSMGHMLGHFHTPWIGITPNHKMTFLRYCEFHCIENGKIQESALHIDIMGILLQVGSRVIPEATGFVTVTPGPQTQDGLLLTEQEPDEGKATLDLIERMITRLIDTGVKTTIEDLKLDWRDDMLWWGPAGIGASYTQQGYLKGHTRPFEDGLEFIRHNGHIVRLGEGNYGGFFGYPSMTMRATGGYMGLTSDGDKLADMRIVDLYRRDGDRLAENWIFIDHLWFLKQLGVDLLQRHIDMTAPVERFA
ncbi:ester cyclase [uncultured Roseobacter sp.]|uniref:ester cyclase n=1 Tax=uncultured Roseobacter sp. TaxID=114847 RepID=UPI00261D3460|nr:ester cyclase [uncultured Roseobacter sp.]